MHKKLLSLLLSVAMVLSLFATVPISALADGPAENWAAHAMVFAGGDGTSGNPFQIATAEQLAYLASIATGDNMTTSNKYYIVTADLDLSAHYWTPIAYFKGNFDGQGHTITGLTINASSSYQGLIGQASSPAQISNVGIVNCDIQSTGACTGAIAGYMTDTQITACFATGTVAGVQDNLGALVGWARNTSITNCYSNCTVSGNNSWGNYGGILGCGNSGVSVTNCYAAGTVTNTGGSSRTGGVVGGVDSSCSCSNSFYNSLNSAGHRGTAMSLVDMQNLGFIDTLNASQSPMPWIADPGTLNGGFPVLAWQVAAPATFTVSIGTLSGGTITANPTSAISGTTIDLTVTPDPDKQLKGGTLKYNDGTNDVSITGTSFTMPAANVTVTAEFENAPVTGFAEDFDTHGLSGWAVADVSGTDGDWSISNTRAHAGAYSAQFNSYSASSGASARLYQTSDLSLSSGQALFFWLYHSTNWSAGNDTVSVQISTDGGSTWQTLGTYSRYTGVLGWEKIELDLGAYAGQTVRFGFLGISAFGEHLYIDDISLNASTPAAPVLQSAATSTGGTKIILTFDKAMADPAGKHGRFTVTAGGSGNSVMAADLGTDTKTIELTLTTPVTPGQSVKVSYTAGTVAASEGGVLASFTNQSVTNNVPAVLIGETEYPSLNEALAAATGTDTIVLISDITYSNAIKADTKNVTIDLNGFDLTVSDVAEHALQATNGNLLIITDKANDEGKVFVSSTGAHRSAANATTGGDIIIEGTLTATYPGGFDNQEIFGASATNLGSTIQVIGNVTGYTAGIHSVNGAEITVTGDVSGSYYGAYAAYEGSVDVTGSLTGPRALVAEYAGIAKVHGTITGGSSGIETNNSSGWGAPNITVTGNVSSSGSITINASNAGDIEITGNVIGAAAVSGTDNSYPEVTVNGDITVSSGPGVSVYYGGAVTVNGLILGASPYLQLNNLDISQDDFVMEAGYCKYSNQTTGAYAPNTVYVTKTNQVPVITSNWSYTTVYFGQDYAYTLTVTDAENTVGTKIYSSLDHAPYSIVWTYPNAPGTQQMTLSPVKGVLAAGSHTLRYYAQDTDGAVSDTLTLTFTVTDKPISPPTGGGGGSSTPDTDTKITVSTTDGSASVNGTMTQTEGGTQVVIKNDAVDKLDTADRQVKVDTQMATVSFDKRAMDAIGSASGSGDVTLTVRKVGTPELTDVQKALVGSRPVYDFTVKGGGTTISSFGGGFATVSVPYTLKAGENPYAVVVWYLSDSGQLVGTRGCYNAATGTVTFMTLHFSSFVIGYNAVSFNDVSARAWYHDAVGFIAARGITTGTSDGMFSPDSTLTRGQFIVMLLRVYGIAPDAKATDNFSDAGNTYYTGYLAAAKRLGISAGIGNNLFAPDQEITRQEMFTLLYNAPKAIGELPAGDSGKKLSDYTDASGIASWAKDAMTKLVESGTISGSGGKLNPTDSTTRAELAQVLYNLLMK